MCFFFSAELSILSQQEEEQNQQILELLTSAGVTSTSTSKKVINDLVAASSVSTTTSSPELSMVLEKAMVMLDSEEFANLSLLLDEYDARAISVEQFSAELAHLLASGNGEKVRTLCQPNIYGNLAAASRE